MTHTISPESRAAWRDPALGARRELSLVRSKQSHQ